MGLGLELSDALLFSAGWDSALGLSDALPCSDPDEDGWLPHAASSSVLTDEITRNHDRMLSAFFLPARLRARCATAR